MATENIAKICSLGFFTKGLVYLLVGVLTIRPSFNWGGSISRSSNEVCFLMDAHWLLLQLSTGEI